MIINYSYKKPRLAKYIKCMLVLSALFICYYSSYAQQTDTASHQLQEIVILQSKAEQFEPSKQRQSIDSTTLEKYNTTNLSDLLANQSHIHIKSYGSSNIATTSARGATASQTALLWNGLNIQNAMLGQPDLSIVPSSLFNSVAIEYGGGSAMWGSGAVGGSILLQNKLGFNQGFKTGLQMSVSSFDTKRINSAVLLSYRKIASHTNVYYKISENNYKYLDTNNKENPNKQVTHANFTNKGLMQELSFLINSSQQLNVRVWYNYMNRNIPNFLGLISKQQQIDENLKLNTDWTYTKKRLNSIIRLGFFNDKLNYADSLANAMSSNSTIKTFIAESDNIYKWKRHRFNFGINYTLYKTQLNYKDNDTSYIAEHTLSKLAFFAAYQLSLLNSKLHYNISIRKEVSNNVSLPFTGSTGLKYQMIDVLAIKVNANKSYRQPTLNDLYWKPGGNPNLKSEDSYEFEGGFEFNYQLHKITLRFEGVYFNRHVNNQIVWLPNSGNYWTPKNMAEVYARGTETKTEISFNNKKIVTKLYINTSYVLSTNQKRINENDNSVGRQLIYTPRYMGLAGILVQYKSITLLYNNHYTGYQFTSTDNTSWLNPYLIGNLKLSYKYSFTAINVELFTSINNLYNKNYMVVANMPMPLINYEAGLKINYSKNKKTNPTTSLSEVIKMSNNQ